MTIEQTFAALFKLVQELDEEEHRAVREGLDEESLAIFDLLKKPDLGYGALIIKYRSLDGAQQNPGRSIEGDASPDSATLHPGYGGLWI